MVYWNCCYKSEDRNTSVLLERCWGRESLAGFHRIRFARESHPDRTGFVILIGWKYLTRPTVKIIYVPNIWSSFRYISLRNPTNFKHHFMCLLSNCFKIRTLNVRWWIFLHLHFLFSRYFNRYHGINNIFPDIKVLMKVIKTETLSVDFPSK